MCMFMSYNWYCDSDSDLNAYVRSPNIIAYLKSHLVSPCCIVSLHHHLITACAIFYLKRFRNLDDSQFEHILKGTSGGFGNSWKGGGAGALKRQVRMTVGIFKPTSKKDLGGGWGLDPLTQPPPPSATGYHLSCHLSKTEGDCLPVVGFLLVSFIK